MKRFLCLIVLAACTTGHVVTAPAPAPQLTVPFAATATFRVNILQKFEDEVPWPVSSGTAWVARNDADGSYLVTAGHVCDESEVEPGVVQSYSLTAPSGLEYTGVTVERRHSLYDLCLLHTPEVVGPALWLSNTDPVYDEPLAAVGAPLGVFGCDESGCGMAPISRGFYGGGRLVSMPMIGGNSGSAVFTANGVIGVLVAGYPRFSHLAFIEPLEHLRDFLD